jgi:hypothetical protein
MAISRIRCDCRPGELTGCSGKTLPTPGLNFKKVDEENNVYSVRIGLAYRALGQIDGEAIVWFWIGPHGDYNKLV